MPAHALFSTMPPARAHALFAALFEKEKPLYKALVETLAKGRNLRPLFVERKPRAERFAWLQTALARPSSEQAAAQLLHHWFTTEHAPLLCDFLDALGIAHDEKGMVENLPEAPPKEKLTAAAEALLAKHPAPAVAFYLHAFQALHETGGWPALGEMLQTDSRLQLA